MLDHFDYFTQMKEYFWETCQIKIAYYWRKKLKRIRRKKQKKDAKKALTVNKHQTVVNNKVTNNSKTGLKND